MNHGPKPFKQLGETLRDLRNSNRESLAEVSGAVEIDEHILKRYEAGIDRPDEEILNLLISHYSLQENLAAQLWELAGYSDAEGGDIGVIEEAMSVAKQLFMVISPENRTIYTDGISVDCSKSGLQITFTQSTPQDRAVVVSKLGMSYEQAMEVIKTIGIALTYEKYGQTHLLSPPNIL